MIRAWHGVCAALGLAACGGDGCSREPGEVARMVAHTGAVERAAAGGDGAWAPADDGQRFLCLDGARTGDGAAAELSLTAGGTLRMKPRTRLRFACGDEGMGVRLELGESEIEGIPALSLDIGMVEISDGGRARLRARDGGYRFEVMVGTAIVRRPDMPDEVMAAGEMISLDIETAVIARVPRDAAPAEPPDAGAEARADAGPADAGPAPVATRAAITGRGARVRAPDSGRWTPLPPGEHDLAPGARLRLGRRTAARVERGAARADVSAGAEVTVGAPDGPLLSAQRGRVELRATDAPVELAIPGGAITARPGRGEGSRTRVDVGRRVTDARGVRGVADVAGAGGGREAVQIGERVEISRSGALKVYGRAPSRTDVAVRAGESATIHDARPPTAVEIRFGEACPQAGVVELTGGRGREVAVSRGEGRARVLLARRAYRYAVRCITDGTLARKPVASGRLVVVRDAGTRPLAQGAPDSAVDADGRRYTVLYQNRLPAITFRWKGAAGGPATLHVVGRRGEQTFAASGPVHRVPAGALREGDYEFYFERGAVRSKPSTLSIEFDNAAPSVYVRSPRVTEAWPRGEVHVAGAVLPGWEVSVDGSSLPLDRQRRFSADVSSDQPAIAIRLSHPQRGVHYYVRRNRGR